MLLVVAEKKSKVGPVLVVTHVLEIPLSNKNVMSKTVLFHLKNGLNGPDVLFHVDLANKTVAVSVI